MIHQPHPTDFMTDEQKAEYYKQKTIKREIVIPINPLSGRIGATAEDFNARGNQEVDHANDLL